MCVKNVVRCLLVLVFFSSCYEETAITIQSDFEISFVNEDKSVPVRIRVENKTKGADEYEWSFDGAEVTSSKDENPGVIKYTKAGDFKIRLKATNVDGEESSVEKQITLHEAIAIDFSAETIGSDFSPVTIKIANATIGDSLTYLWEFEQGTPSTSTDKNPENILFTAVGEHTIKVTVSNGFESFTSERKVTVLPKLVPDFDWEVDFFDDDYQVPVTIQLNNNSVSATSYEWSFENGVPLNSNEENPTVTFTTPGIYRIILKASNDKATRQLIKTIEVFPNKNLRVFEEVKLGVNAAHNSNVIGAFFSSELRKVLTSNEVTNESKVDVAFLSLNNTFSFNKFISPDEANSNGFSAIPNATKTKFINNLENCGCGISFTSDDFDVMENDTPLQTINIVETPNGLLHFNNNLVPRIVLFQTEDGRKGAIKIKEFVDDGVNSFIRCDIKIQKLP